MEKNALDWIALVLVIIGAINWGLFSFGINLVEYLSLAWLIKLVYWLIGLSGLYMLYFLSKQ